MAELCFVCCHDNGLPTYKVCKCNTAIHDRCFHQMVHTVSSHKTSCAICRTRYKTEIRCKAVELVTRLMAIIAMSMIAVLVFVLSPRDGFAWVFLLVVSFRSGLEIARLPERTMHVRLRPASLQTFSGDQNRALHSTRVCGGCFI